MLLLKKSMYATSTCASAYTTVVVVMTFCMYCGMQEGKSALMLVCERDHISLLLTVLDGGAEVNFQQQVNY